jgi:uncharacterized membrane protein
MVCEAKSYRHGATLRFTPTHRMRCQHRQPDGGMHGDEGRTQADGSHHGAARADVSQANEPAASAAQPSAADAPDADGDVPQGAALARWLLRAESQRWDCWEVQFDLQHAAGVLRAARAACDTASMLRFDLPHAIAQDCGMRRAAASNASRVAGPSAWWLACLGCLLLAFGGVLCVLGVQSARDELTTLGSPAAVAGGLLLVLAVVVQRRDPPTMESMAVSGHALAPHIAPCSPQGMASPTAEAPRRHTGPQWSSAVRQAAHLPLADPGSIDDVA